MSNIKLLRLYLFTDDSPPSIRIKIGIGSGAFEPSGVLAVLPASTIHLDCMYPRRRGTPEWTTTGWFRSYYIGKLIYIVYMKTIKYFIIYVTPN